MSICSLDSLVSDCFCRTVGFIHLCVCVGGGGGGGGERADGEEV